MQQLLKPAERAEEAADEAAQQHAKKDEDAGDVIGKLEFGRADDSLKRADGTRARRTRARVAVQSRHAHGLACAAIERTREEVRQVQIRQQSRAGLDQSAPAGEQKGKRFFLIQCPHTPDIV